MERFGKASEQSSEVNRCASKQHSHYEHLLCQPAAWDVSNLLSAHTSSHTLCITASQSPYSHKGSSHYGSHAKVHTWMPANHLRIAHESFAAYHTSRHLSDPATLAKKPSPKCKSSHEWTTTWAMLEKHSYKTYMLLRNSLFMPTIFGML